MWPTRLLMAAPLIGVLIFWPDVSPPPQAATRRVPMSYPTIQAGIDAATPGDSILVAPGVYAEALDTRGKHLVVCSEAGPQGTVIDAGQQGSVIRMSGGGVVDGFTLRNGQAEQGGGVDVTSSAGSIVRNNIIENNRAGTSVDVGLGGGVAIYFVTNVIIESNTIRGNYAGDSGGGIYCLRFGGGSVEIRNNTVAANGCHVCGGGLRVSEADVTNNLVVDNWADSFGAGLCLVGGGRIENNTVVGNYNNNSFQHGAGIHFSSVPPDVVVSRNLVVHNRGLGGSGIGIKCSGTGTHPGVVECNDAWGNDTDFFGCDTTGRRNFSVDPQFCGETRGDFRLTDGSPCSAASGGGCGLVGAFDVGCAVVAAQRRTWGSLKVRYR